MHQLLFKLDHDPKGRGLRCDGDGLFFGGNALLRRDGEGDFEARSDDELRKTFGSVCGDDTDWDSRIRSVKLVANAMNKGDMARAMMTAVLMRLPDPGSAIRITDVDGVLAKAGYDPDEPRDERGRWTNGGAGTIFRRARRTSPGMNRVDIEFPKIEVPELGARYVEIKPLTESGFKRFRADVARWKLTEPVLPLTYDYDGNIYYGFPR